MTLSIDHSVVSPNSNARPAGVKISAIVIHTTEGKWPSDLQWLASAKSQVSCHYVISPTGKVYQIVADERRAWHAGVGAYLGISDWNDISIGIEVSRKQGDPWTEAQRSALKELCQSLITKYSIPQSRIAAHRWIAPERRSDPTDWPDPALASWIADLYAGPNYDTLWGTLPYHPDWGIETAWRPYASVLGAAVSDETGDKVGRTWRLFLKGAVSYDPKDGRTEVYLPRVK